MKKLVMLSIVLCVASASVQAGTEVYEGFNYDEGGYYEPQDAGNNLGGDYGWSQGAWLQGTKNGIDVTPTSGQTFGALPTSGLGATSAANLWGTRSRKLDGSLAGAGLLNDGATLYFSVLARNSGGTDKLGVALANDDFSSSSSTVYDLNDGQGFGIYADNGSDLQAVGWDTGNYGGFGSEDIGINSTTLIVGELIWGADGSSADTLNLYTPDASTLTQGGIVTSTTQTLDQSTFDRVSLLVKEGAYIDEIRIGASYDDVIGVVPEPSAFALLGLGGLALLRRRRR